MSAPDPAVTKARIAAEIGMVGVVLIWGMNFTIVKASVEHIPPMAFTAVRFLVASLALILLVKIIERDKPISSSNF